MKKCCGCREFATMVQEFGEWEGRREGGEQTESGEDGRGCGGRMDGHRDFHPRLMLGSLEKDECLSLTEFCHGLKGRNGGGMWGWRAFSL